MALKSGEIYFTRAETKKDDIYMFFVRDPVRTNYPTMTIIHEYDVFLYSFEMHEWYPTRISVATKAEDYIEMGKQKKNAIKDLFLYQDAFRE